MKVIFLKAVENPDVIIDHNNKCDCGHELENIEIKKKQEINIKIIKEITEHRYYEGYCPVCKKVHSNKIPDNLKNPMNYGASVKSLVALLISQGVVSINRTSEFISLITNNSINISNGTISNWIKELACKLEPVIDDITEKLLNSELLHVDESPIKVNGKQMYVHNASTENYVLQVPHEKKSIVAMEEIGLLPKYAGIIMSDHYKAYYNFGTSNAECNVHITRYLKNITETTSHKWAEKFSNFLYNIKDEKEDIINKSGKEFNSEKLNYIYKEYDDILESGLKEYKSSEYKDDSERKLLNRLINYIKNHLMFINNFKVPFSNNEAERSLRGVKTKQKIGKFRTLDGAKYFCVIKSVELTSKKNKKNFFEVISNAFKNIAINIKKELNN